MTCLFLRFPLLAELILLQGLTPVLGIDVWEHAYYKQYNNLRPKYLENIWKVVNWKDVSDRLAAAKSG